MKTKLFSASIILLIAYFSIFYVTKYWDFGKAMNENMILGDFGLQLTSLAFCLTSSNFNLIDVANGHLEEDDYLKESIYSILYSMYAWQGVVESDKNVSYQFTFNTWGFGPSLYSNDEPQRFGMTAYKSLTLFDEIQNTLKKLPKGSVFRLLEVGCGTGAGGNLISSELQNEFKDIDIKYTALDMQAAAVQTCNKLYSIYNPSLECIQGNGKQLGFKDNVFDMVIVSETHIAEINVDNETKLIINEIIRVMKDQAYFVWGNALFTDTWNDINNRYLPSQGFASCGIHNVTKGAIQARIDDTERVEKWLNGMLSRLYAFRYFTDCYDFAWKLILNFFRHPGTNLFNTMVNGTDSYLQICNQITK